MCFEVDRRGSERVEHVRHLRLGRMQRSGRRTCPDIVRERLLRSVKPVSPKKINL
jgi:hypothetical protein